MEQIEVLHGLQTSQSCCLRCFAHSKLWSGFKRYGDVHWRWLLRERLLESLARELWSGLVDYLRTRWIQPTTSSFSPSAARSRWPVPAHARGPHPRALSWVLLHSSPARKGRWSCACHFHTSTTHLSHLHLEVRNKSVLSFRSVFPVVLSCIDNSSARKTTGSIFTKEHPIAFRSPVCPSKLEFWPCLYSFS